MTPRKNPSVDHPHIVNLPTPADLLDLSVPVCLAPKGRFETPWGTDERHKSGLLSEAVLDSQ